PGPDQTRLPSRRVEASGGSIGRLCEDGGQWRARCCGGHRAPQPGACRSDVDAVLRRTAGTAFARRSRPKTRTELASRRAFPAVRPVAMDRAAREVRPRTAEYRAQRCTGIELD